MTILYSAAGFSRLQAYRKKGWFVDFEIAVKGGTRRFGVHRVVLCAASDMFEAMFSHDMKEAITGKLELEEIGEDTVERMLEYIYTGTMVPVVVGDSADEIADEMDGLLDLLVASGRFMLPELMSMVERALCTKKYIRLETVRHILKRAVAFNAKDLEAGCREFILRNDIILQKMGD